MTGARRPQPKDRTQAAYAFQAGRRDSRDNRVLSVQGRRPLITIPRNAAEAIPNSSSSIIGGKSANPTDGVVSPIAGRIISSKWLRRIEIHRLVDR